jgi:hypothetical protein
MLRVFSFAIPFVVDQRVAMLPETHSSFFSEHGDDVVE